MFTNAKNWYRSLWGMFKDRQLRYHCPELRQRRRKGENLREVRELVEKQRELREN